MLYRASRPPSDTPTPLETYVDSNMLNLFRYYMPMRDRHDPTVLRPNHDFSPMIQSAVRISEIIDTFDNHEHLLEQVIFGIACPELSDPGVQDLITGREMVAILLVRHFKNRGGLVLPPRPEVRDVQAAHEVVVRADLNAGRVRTEMRYLNWRQSQNTAAAFEQARAARDSPHPSSPHRGSPHRGSPHRARGGFFLGPEPDRGSPRGGYGGNT